MNDLPEVPNPFKSPRSEVDTDASDHHQVERPMMPTSVFAAMVSLAFTILFCSIEIFLDSNFGQIGLVSVSILVSAVLILIGLAKGHRLAYQWGRILGLVGGLSLPVILLLLLIGLSAIANNRIALDIDLEPKWLAIDQTTLAFLVVINVAAVCVSSWSLFFSLGDHSARRYFLLFCPNCDQDQVRANDLLYSHAKCRNCGTIW